MAKRTTAKARAKGGASKSAPKSRSKPATAKKKVSAKRKTASAAKAASGVKRRKATTAKATAKKKTTRAAVKKKTGATAKKTTKKTAATAAKRRAKASAVSKPDATTQDPIQFPEQEKPPKTHLTAKELRGFRDLLLRKRAELVGYVQGLADEALHGDGRSQGDRSAMPIHMADLGTDNWEQEFTLGLLASEQALVREIDDALGRIRDKTYGVCLSTHNKISMARLRAKPWAS